MIIKGYKGKLSLEEIKRLASKNIYVFNPNCVVGKEHLIYAYKKAKDAFKKGKNIAREFHIELMLILTGRRQIDDALSLASLEYSKGFVAISEKDFDLPYPREDGLIECREEKLEHLGINVRVRRDKLCDLAFENSALIELQR